MKILSTLNYFLFYYSYLCELISTELQASSLHLHYLSVLLLFKLLFMILNAVANAIINAVANVAADMIANAVVNIYISTYEAELLI